MSVHSFGAELPEELEPVLFDGGATIFLAECALPTEMAHTTLCLLSRPAGAPLPDVLPAGSGAFRCVASLSLSLHTHALTHSPHARTRQSRLSTVSSHSPPLVVCV